MALDGTEERKDTTQQAEESSGEKQGTSEKEPETLTKEQVEEIKTKAASDALATAGRTAKAFEKREEAITKREEGIAQKERERREAEIERDREDPTALTATQQRHKQEDKAAELAKRERELDDKDTKADEKLEKVTKAEIKERAETVALKHSVDADTLVKHTDGSLEAMEDLAKSLPKKEEKPPLKPDSSTTIGGGAMPDSAKGKMREGWDELHKSK